MNEEKQRYALIPITESVDVAGKLFVHEAAAAEALEIPIQEFRRLVGASVIPYRLLCSGRRRLYLVDDLKAYAKSLEPQYAKNDAG